MNSSNIRIRAGRLLMTAMNISAALVVFLGLLVVCDLAVIYFRQSALNNIRQVPFKQEQWMTVRDDDIGGPNARAAMKMAVMNRLKLGESLESVLVDLRHPDSVWTLKELHDQRLKFPPGTAMAIGYNFERSWDDLISVILCFFDAGGKLCGAASEVF